VRKGGIGMHDDTNLSQYEFDKERIAPQALFCEFDTVTGV